LLWANPTFRVEHLPGVALLVRSLVVDPVQQSVLMVKQEQLLAFHALFV
jgi:hypothetical protein